MCFMRGILSKEMMAAQSKCRFDPNPDMAEAWLRLRSGTHVPQDLLLLEHELAEHNYW